MLLAFALHEVTDSTGCEGPPNGNALCPFGDHDDPQIRDLRPKESNEATARRLWHFVIDQGDIGLFALTLIDEPGTDIAFDNVKVTAVEK